VHCRVVASLRNSVTRVRTTLTYSSASSYTEKDTRKFDVVVEGDLIEDVDIVKEAGAIFTAMKRETLIIPVTDGVLNIQFKQNDPQVRTTHASSGVASPERHSLASRPASIRPRFEGQQLTVSCSHYTAR
jgi:Malectin domain